MLILQCKMIIFSSYFSFFFSTVLQGLCCPFTCTCSAFLQFIRRHKTYSFMPISNKQIRGVLLAREYFQWFAIVPAERWRLNRSKMYFQPVFEARPSGIKSGNAQLSTSLSHTKKKLQITNKNQILQMPLCTCTFHIFINK